MRNTLYAKASWSIIVAFTLFKVFYSGAFLLAPDEAYYWQWSRHLALGYHDHPPMLAWMIHFAGNLIGQTETAVRLPAVLSHAIASVYLFLIAARWVNAKAAFYTVVLAQSILGFNVAGLISTPDSPLLAGWAGACYHIARAYEDGAPGHWLTGGAWFGFGLLSKYTMILFPPLVFLFGLTSAQPRKQLARPWPYAGVLLGVLMFVPVILWNMDNGWSTFRHVAHKGGVDRTALLRLDFVLDFIGSQAALLSPLVFLLLILVWFSPFRKSSGLDTWIYKYLFFLSFPVVLTFTLLSLHTRVEGNWAAPGYLTAAVLIGGGLANRTAPGAAFKGHTASRKIWPWAVGTSCLLTGLIFVHAVWPILPIPIKWDRIAKETSGWSTLGQRVKAMQQTMPHPEKTFVFGLKYQTASQLAFYMPGQPETVSINRWTRPNAYDYWLGDEDLLGWDAVGVGSASEKSTQRLKQLFESVSTPERLDILRQAAPAVTGNDGTPVSSYYLYRAYGFKGGLKWIPENRSDVRAGQP